MLQSVGCCRCKQQALLHSDFLLRGAMVVACPAQLCVVQLALFCCAQPVDKIAFRYERRGAYCKAIKLALKLHPHSVQHAYSLVESTLGLAFIHVVQQHAYRHASTIRTTEKTSFNAHKQDQARGT
eukprot:scaffold11132_cov18-Tisochrysis_lutea.AAC.1